MAAVGRNDLVLGVELLADPDRDCFLTAVEMRKAGDLAGLDLCMKPFLELADCLHLAISARQRVTV